MRRGKSKRKGLAVFMTLAIIVSVALSVIAAPGKVVKAETGDAMGAAVSVLDNTVLEALGWAANKTGDEGQQEIYKMLSIATEGSGTDQMLKYCQEIMDSLGKIQQEISAVDTHLTQLIDEYQKRAIQLEISSSYKAMIDPAVECDRIINAYNAYITAAEAYAKAQQDGSSKEEVEQKKQAAQQSASALTSQFIRVGDDITDPKEKGLIGTDKYEKKMEALASAACTNAISYLPDTPGAFHQIKGATFTGLLYEGYSRSYNVFDHQHREAVETGVNASASVFVKILMAYRIQLDYVRAENKDLVNQGVIDQKEADKRMEIYDLKYADYVNAVVNAVNDIAGMYQKELAGLMHAYDLNVPYDVLPYDAAQEQKVTWWYPTVEWGQQYAASHTENYIPQPGGLFKFEEAYKDFFYRVNVGKISYLISKQYKPCHMSPASFIHKDYQGGLANAHDFKFRGRDFYNFAATRDGSYRMINDAQELTELFSTSAWSHAANGFISYLSGSGQLTEIDTGASYIIINKLYKEQPPNMYHDNKYYDGQGKDKTYFHQEMYYLMTGFSYQTTPQEHLYSSGSNDSTSKVMLIMKENKESQPDYGITTNAVNVLDGQSVDKQQIQVNRSRALPGERLEITITPNEGWTLDSLTISEDGELRDTLCGPEAFSYLKDENGSFTFLYDMPYGDVTLKASFKVEEGGDLDGNGTPENPYLIADVEDYLTAVQMIEGYTPSAKAHYKVVNDIDFSSLKGTERTEIGAYFSGVWDGGGHTFRNLGPRNHNGDGPWMQRIEKDGVVKNLTFENNRFINLVTTNCGTIDSCGNTGVSQGSFQGLTYENTGKILNCYNTAEIIGDRSRWVGAITQNNNKGGLVANCFNRGEFKSLQNNCEAGGLLLYNEGRVYNCYNTGKPDNSGIQHFGPLIYYEVKDKEAEEGVTVENGFYPDTLAKWSELPLQHYPVGTMLTEEEMHSDNSLLKKLNEGVGKAKKMAETAGLGLKYWGRGDEVNDGYPVLIDGGAERSITVESEFGTAELAFLDGTKVEGTAPARIPLALTVTPDKGWVIEKITLLKSSGEMIWDIPVTDRNQEVFTVQFAMPEKDCILKVDYEQLLQVAAPVFNPAGGTYNSPQSVEITCATGDAEIYYTTDDSQPTTGSVKYTGAIMVAETITLKAIAVKAGMMDSATAEAAYVIEIPPAHVHSWEDTWMHDDSYHWHECTAADCPVTENGKKDGYGAHTAGEWSTTQQPTETEAGSKKKECTVCGRELETAEIPATGSEHTHKLNHVAAKAATCVDSGNIEYWFCEGCGKYFSNGTGGNEMEYSATILPATGAHTAASKANCHAKAVCEVCGTEYGEPDLDNHDGDTEVRDQREATETEDGYTGDTYCMGCGVVIAAGTKIPATGHTHTFGGEWQKDDKGHWQLCIAGDGAADKKAAHTAGEWIDDKPLSDNELSRKHKECTVCGYTMAVQVTEKEDAAGETNGTGSTENTAVNDKKPEPKPDSKPARKSEPPSGVPATGDESVIWPWILLLLAALGSGSTLLIYRKKKMPWSRE